MGAGTVDRNWSFFTLFTMWVLIINSNFATAGPWHFEMQKNPPKENLLKKNIVAVIDAQGFRKTKNENPPTCEIEVTS